MPTSTQSDISSHFALSPTLEALAGSDLSATECLEAALARIAVAEDAVRAWVVVDDDGARSQAQALDALPVAQRGPLHGLPVAVKDIVDVRGLPTRCGSPTTPSAPASADATIVRALREAGALILGKTVTTEFAYFAPGPTANPRHCGHTPGGSSSGSAAAVAAGMTPLAVGTQTAASVTRPAAYCGVFAVVLPRGLMPIDGIAGLAESLDSPGFLGSDALGLAAVLDAVLATEEQSTPPISRVLVWRPGPSFAVHRDMLAALERISEYATGQGLAVDEIDLDADVTALVDTHRRIMAYEAARQSRAAMMPRDRLSASLRALLDEGASIDRGTYESARGHAHTARQELIERLGHGSAAILAPAALGPAPEGLAATGDPMMSRPWQALGLATVTFPAGRSGALPLGLQLVGRGDGRTLLRLADAVTSGSVHSQ